jgi:hypothetical protein
MRRPYLPALVPLALAAACATGSPGLEEEVPVDAALDAAPPDAGPVEVTLSQTTSDTIVAPNTVACVRSIDQVPQNTLENRFYRSFPLAVHGVTGQFSAARIDLGVEEATAGGGTQTINVRLHTVQGAFPSGTLSLLREVPVAVTNTNSTPRIVEVPLAPPVVVPGGGTLVVEVHAPELPTGGFFFPGSNRAGESAPSYVMATDCNVNSPTPFTSVAPAGSTVHLVLSVTGTTP